MNQSRHTLILCGCTFVSLVVLAQLAHAQQGRRAWRMYGDNYSVGVALLEIEQVQKELGLSAEQIKKASELGTKLAEDRRRLYETVPREEWRERGNELREKSKELAKSAALSIAESLDDAQTKRWLEVALQVRGPESLPDDYLTAQLKLDPDQVKKLTDLAIGQREKAFEIFRRSRDEGLSRDDARAQFATLVSDTNKERMAVLTDEQRTAFQDLQGDKFELPEE